MGFDLNEFVSYSSINDTINNPVYTSIVIIIMILIIVYWFFYTPYAENVDTEEYPSFWKTLLRSGVYISATVLGVTMYHYKIIADDFRSKQENKSLNNVVSAVTDQGVDEILKVGEGEMFKEEPSLITSDNVIIM
jgi:hypothetical protein